MSISRRGLLVRSAAVVAGVQVAGVTRMFAADETSKPGVQMYMVQADFKKDPAGTLKQLAAIVYGYVEAFAMGISSIPEFKKMLADAGLGCPAGHFGFGFMPTEKVLDQVRAYPWPPQPEVPDGWAYGCDGAYLKGLCEHWTQRYDWRAAMADLMARIASSPGLSIGVGGRPFFLRVL